MKFNQSFVWTKIRGGKTGYYSREKSRKNYMRKNKAQRVAEKPLIVPVSVF